jgi:transposase
MPKLREEDVTAMDVMQRRGWSKRALAREMGVDESTVRYRLKRRREGAVDGRKRQEEVCAAFEPAIRAWLDRQGERGSGRPCSVKSLYLELVSERGYRGSYKAVLRYVRRRTPPPPVRPIRRVEVAPGSQAQVDWVEQEAWVEEYGGLVALAAFVMVLSFSRMWAVVWSVKKDLASWIRCHNEAFVKLGGVPATERIDNLKTGVSSGAGPWAELHPGFKSYAGQMGFLVNPARVRRPQDKGKVERRGKDLHGLIQPWDRFATLDSLQRATDERVLAKARERLCPVTGRSILETWGEEKVHLRALPASLPEPFDVQVLREADEACLVPFEGRQYQVPLGWCGREVLVRGCADRVKILSREGQLLLAYPRGTECRLLIDQSLYDGEGDGRVLPAIPLGKVARRIVLQRTWEAPRRAIDAYAALVGGAP